MMMDIAVLQPPKYWGVYFPILEKIMQETNVQDPVVALQIELADRDKSGTIFTLKDQDLL